MTEHAESRHEKEATAGRATDVMSEIGRELDQEVLAILGAESPLHVMDIARTADRHPITVDQTCARLHEHGQIHPVGRGLYKITDDGKRQTGDDSES
ncbi:transcriptional regulator [Halovenus rubra]|uniref:Transcriptional regulator n=2 Tax=Halovenus rubra TaxID=869890 RepID=A0ACC7E4K4_9EURY|nr:transcriptional regulator [Halovenus rubra]